MRVAHLMRQLRDPSHKEQPEKRPTHQSATRRAGEAAGWEGEVERRQKTGSRAHEHVYILVKKDVCMYGEDLTSWMVAEVLDVPNWETPTPDEESTCLFIPTALPPPNSHTRHRQQTSQSS